MGWLQDGGVDFDYRRKINLRGQAGAAANYLTRIVVTNNGYPVEYSAAGWAIDDGGGAHTYHYRVPFTINYGVAHANLQVDIPVDIQWLRYNRYIASTADGDEFQFVDEHGTVCNYWYDNVRQLNYSTVDVTVKVAIDAGETKQMYLYCDPAAPTSDKFSKTSTFQVFSGLVAAQHDDCRVYYTGAVWALATNAAFWGFGRFQNNKVYSGARWQNVGITKDYQVIEAYLTVCANGAWPNLTIGYLIGELPAGGSAANYNGETVAGWNARTRTAARSRIYNEEAFVDHVNYYWPCRDIVQEIINHANWASGNAMAIDAFDDGTSTNGWFRDGHGWTTDATRSTKLDIVARVNCATQPTVVIAFCHASLLSHATNPPADIRFTATDGTTLISAKYMAEESDSDTYSWILTIPDLSADLYIWVYYGHPTAVLLSTDPVTAGAFFSDFSADAVDADPATGFVKESGTWLVKNDGLFSDPFSPDGCWNNVGYKVASNRWYMMTASNWRLTTGLCIAKSIDGQNFKHLKYYPLPWPMGNQWLAQWYLEGGIYYGVFEGCIEDKFGYVGTVGKQNLYMVTTTDFEHFTPPVCIYQNNTYNAYAPFLTKFGAIYVIYCSVSGLRMLTSAAVTGPYVDSGNSLAISGETASVFYQVADAKYYVYFTDIAAANHIHWISANDMYFQVAVSAAANATYDKTPYWASAGQFGARILWDAAANHYKMYYSGLRTTGIPPTDLGEGVLGYAYKAALGAGNWTIVDKKAYWCTVDPGAATVKVRLDTLGQVTNQVILARIKGTGANTLALLHWRCALNNATFYEVYVDATTNKVLLRKYTGGAYVAMTDVAIPWNTVWGVVPHVIKDVEIRHEANLISVFVNGWPAITAYDDSAAPIAGPGYVKFATYDELAMLKHILVRPYITDGAGIVEPGFLSAEGEWMPSGTGGNPASKLIAAGVI